MLFARFLLPVVEYLRNVLGYRYLWYREEFPIAPRGGKEGTSADCLRASFRLDHFLEALGIAQHPTKGVRLEGAQGPEVLELRLSTATIRFTMTDKKQ